MSQEILYCNGTIRTMASHRAEEAMLIRDGRVAAVGPFSAVGKASPGAHRVDLRGRCLMPAFLDAHSHIVSWSMGKLQADLSGARDFHAIAAVMGDFTRRRGIAPGRWVVGRGADLLLDERLAAELDRGLPDRPALVQHASSQGGVFNTAAQRALGLSRGTLVETPYIEAQKKVPMPALEELTAAFREAQEDYLSHGYVLAQEGCMMEEAARLYRAFAAAGAIQMAIVSYGQPDMACDGGPIPTVGLSNRGNKIFLDGSPQQRTAFLRAPYVGGGLGEATMTEEEVLAAVRSAAAAGRQLLAHCNGDAAAEQLLEIGVKVNVKGMSWDEIAQVMFSEAVMMGWGSANPNETYYLYRSQGALLDDFYNPEGYMSDVTDGYLNAAMEALTVEEANENWRKAQWDGTTGTAMQGECPWVWIVNLDHVTYVRDGLSIGEQPIHGHGHGLPLIQNLQDWAWEETG